MQVLVITLPGIQEKPADGWQHLRDGIQSFKRSGSLAKGAIGLENAFVIGAGSRQLIKRVANVFCHLPNLP